MKDPTTEAREDVEAVAALVGTVNASLGQIDKQIVSTSTNLQHSKDNWNPKQVLKDEIKAAGTSGEGAVLAPPPPSQPVQVHQPVQHIQQPVMQQPVMQQPVMQQPVMQQPVMQPQAFITDPQILERLDKIEEALSTLCLTDEKIMKSLLKNNTKQITIRFDDSKSSK